MRCLCVCVICVSVYLVLQNEVSDDYVQSRVAAVQDIESTIAELATMYQRLAILVKQQEEQAVRFGL